MLAITVIRSFEICALCSLRKLIGLPYYAQLSENLLILFMGTFGQLPNFSKSWNIRICQALTIKSKFIVIYNHKRREQITDVLNLDMIDTRCDNNKGKICTPLKNDESTIFGWVSVTYLCISYVLLFKMRRSWVLISPFKQMVILVHKVFTKVNLGISVLKSRFLHRSSYD